jgi:hypothetical protein
MYLLPEIGERASCEYGCVEGKRTSLPAFGLTAKSNLSKYVSQPVSTSFRYRIAEIFRGIS